MDRALRNRLFSVLGLVVALLAGVAVYALATNLFPYHSVNDDEGVYLLQAAMLLEGQLFIYPGQLAEVVRPWFFVVADAPAEVGGVKMYGKYSPVAPAVFALSKLLTGDFNVVLGVLAAGSAALVYALTAEAFDRKTGVLAGLVLLGSPLFLVTSSTFLAYAPTTFFNLLFAFAYVRSRRSGENLALAWGALAGTAIGVAFFARSYTAVLFALPFIGHALVSLARTWGKDAFEPTLRNLLAVALPGLAFVVLTLAYNLVVTGDPLVFPYAAFAPRDGLGFGPHEILGYEENYTPTLAAETTVRLLVLFATEWTTAGLFGTAAFLVGFGVVLWRAVVPTGAVQARLSQFGGGRKRRGGRGSRTKTSLSKGGKKRRRTRQQSRRSPLSKAGRVTNRLSDRELRLVLAGLVPSVVLGNAYFWGTHNGLRNDLIELLGPFYHFDLLLPLSAFGAYGVLVTARTLARESRARFSASEVRGVLLLALVVTAPLAATAEMQVLSEPFEENGQRTANLATTYEPIVETEFDDALVYVPDPYGDWQQHPFQYLRNDPGFDGDVVYALDEGPDRDIETLDAVGDRTPYRFTYRGEWSGAVEPVTPALVPLEVLEGDRVEATSTLGTPAQASAATVRLETEEDYARYTVDDVGESVRVDWAITADSARVSNLPRAGGAAELAVPDGASEVDLVVTFVTESGATVTYRQEATVDSRGDEVRALWPPETRVCRLTTECGMDRTYVGPDGDYLSGVSVETDARAVNETA
ncbi:Dolichyl-phosphate-mannose-protein mannosyltransferase [Halogranum gelatinilyticum]|uniref:Dolichyl-phosphate-mannose-protein mannosyltransferase n=1 Tax=Halogranum gelatinilyticum TaxID=660521 RepID=A0A1G9WKK6_9EURY|nr:glycosyltransferase family 39 protein [Halogranum gelatinilyticum]SDM84575.1 Dolichyl-phosphate-mannose-protein mannosyltransferase [Halogranum gelatinilyticum]